ncbi:MAG: hypothetical protein K6E20_07240, partial [Acholeplasmatales bacterium]|nr:hypothetical protein [Acholeplasmatales bacterium]
IIDFDSKVYFNNLILSTIESVANNIDNLKFTEDLSAKNVELLKIILKKDYLSDYIPEEKEAKAQGKTAADIGGVATLDITNLLTREDTASLAVALLSIIGATTEDTKYAKVSRICDNLVPAITDLSILSSDRRKEEVNPFFARLYTAINNIYLNDEEESSVSPLKSELRLNDVTKLSSKYSDLDWQVELQSLLTTADDLVTIFDNIYVDDGGKIDASMFVGTIFDVFDTSHAKYAENIELYNEVEESIENSKLLGMVLDSSFVCEKISKQVTKVYSDAYAYDSINYIESETEHGEFYQFLNTIEAIAGDKTNKDILLDLIDNSVDTSSTSAVLDLIDNIAKMLNTKNSDNVKAIDYALNSKIVQSYLSAYILANRDLGDATLYIPSESYELIDGTTVNMISNEELLDLFDYIPLFIDMVDPYFDETSENYENVDYLLDSLSKDEYIVILDNKIIEGTISSVAKSKLAESENVKMPLSYSNIEEWLSTDTKEGEIKALVKTVNKGNISISTVMNETDTNELLKVIKALPEDAIEECIKSNILVYTISDYVETHDLNGVKIVVPNVVRINLEEDSIPYKVTDNELYNFMIEVQKILPEDSNNVSSNELVRDVMINRKTIVKSYIISTTVVNYFVNDNAEVKEQIVVPEHLQLDAKYDDTDKTLLDYTDGTDWFIELPFMLESIEAYVGFTRDDSIDLDDEEGTTIKMKSNVKNLNLTLSKVYSDLGKTYDGTDTRTILEICEKSNVTYATISVNVGNMLTEETETNPNGIIKPEQKSVMTDEFKHTYKGVEYVYKYYSNEELKNLANVINELNIDIENIVLEDVMNKFITLNDETQLEQYQTSENKPSKLEVLYPSEIFDVLLYNAIQDEIERSTILVDGGSDSKVSSIHEIEVYSQYELSQLVRFVNVIDTSRTEEEQAAGSIKIGSITLQQIVLTDDQINTASSSYIISATITKQLLTNNTFIINENYYYNNNKSIIKDELVSLLTNIVDFTGTNVAADLVSYNINNATITSDNIQYITGSNILVSTVSDVVGNNDYVNLNRDYVTEFEAINLNESTTTKFDITKLQLEAFLNSLVNMGFGNVSSITSNSIDTLVLSSTIVTSVTSSDIMTDTVSKNIIDNNNVVVRKDEAYSLQINIYGGSLAYTLVKEELSKFLNALISMNLTQVSNINETAIKSLTLNDEMINNMTSSGVMTDTVAK